MRDIEEIRANIRLQIEEDTDARNFGHVMMGYIRLKEGAYGTFIAGFDEDGMEHVSIKLRRKALPSWYELCEVKDIFWKDEEEVVQIHPKKSEYVNITDAMHLWRPKNGDWSIMNEEESNENR